MSDFVYDRDMLALLPPWYAAVAEYQEICRAEEAEFEALKTASDNVYNNFFFSTMDENAVAQWEAALNILAAPTVETLDERRQRLILKLSTRPPFSISFLFSRLDELLGSGTWDVSTFGNKLRVEFMPPTFAASREIAALIEKIKPAHISYEVDASTSAQLVICEEIYAIRTAHNYILGSWALGEKPFATSGARELVKPASEPSVQSRCNEAIADALSTAITLLDYDWQSTSGGGGEDIISIGAVVAFGYMSFSAEISRENVQRITYIALKDIGLAGDKTFFAMPVSIEVVGTTNITINIIIKAGGEAAWDD